MEEDMIKAASAGDPDDVAVQLPEWALPAKRTDAIGNLAWRLVGEPGGMPDFTAALPLYDAMLEIGDTESALRLQRAIVGMLADIHQRVARPRALRNWMSNLRDATMRAGHVLLYDFGSVAGVLARAVEIASAPAPAMVEETAAVTTVRADVGYRSLGTHVTLPDGRSGTVIGESDDNGMSRIMIDAA